MSKIALIVGTRPNIIKITQFRDLIERNTKFSLHIIHSNQHYSDSISKDLFKQLGIRVDTYLPQYVGDNASQLGFIITELSKEIRLLNPKLVIAVGDVNTTLAAGIVANKLSIKLAHLESGLRSFDLSMPEEVNRILVDKIADFYFVTEKSGIENLLHEGCKKESIFFVGNTMIDTLVAFKDLINAQKLPFEFNPKAKLLTLTLHRPSNVDTKEGLEKILNLVEACAKNYTIVFPVHPRTRKQLDFFSLSERMDSINNLIQVDPLDYLTFQKLLSVSHAVVTDSGGIQEETTFLKIPCVTLRKNTERPITIEKGTNILLDFNPQLIIEYLAKEGHMKCEIPELWDGKATERIVSILTKIVD